MINKKKKKNIILLTDIIVYKNILNYSTSYNVVYFAEHLKTTSTENNEI